VLATMPAAETVSVVAYKGYEYRTRDGASPTVTAIGCERPFAVLGSVDGVWGWSVAPSNADSTHVGNSYPWSTHVMVWAGGCTGTTLYPSCAGISLETSGSQYQTSNCNARILFRRACRPGNYHGSTSTIYAQALGATCTSCPAGEPPPRRPSPPPTLPTPAARASLPTPTPAPGSALCGALRRRPAPIALGQMRRAAGSGG